MQNNPLNVYVDRTAASKGSRADLIRDALTEEIATGRLAPGSTLEEAQVADRFGTSRTPVREALQQLETMGLVQQRPRRGFAVLTLTPENLSDMFEYTAEIESVSARLATHRMTASERAGLESIHEQSTAAVSADDIEAYAPFNIQFHEAIFRATHNPFLVEQAIALRTRLLPFRRAQLQHKGRLAVSFQQHSNILRAMARGDGEEAARSMREHVLSSSTALIRFLADSTTSSKDGI